MFMGYVLWPDLDINVQSESGFTRLQFSVYSHLHILKVHVLNAAVG